MPICFLFLFWQSAEKETKLGDPEVKRGREREKEDGRGWNGRVKGFVRATMFTSLVFARMDWRREERTRRRGGWGVI